MSFATTQEMGGSITVKDEGVTLTSSATSIDLVGAGITGTNVGAAVTATVGAGAGLNFANNETPTGSINDSNVTFTLANSPSPVLSLDIKLNGALQTAGGVDFTLSGATVTFVVAPPTGSILRASYRY